VLIALPMAVGAVMLFRSGIETRGRRLEEIQDALSIGNASGLRADGGASAPR